MSPARKSVPVFLVGLAIGLVAPASAARAEPTPAQIQQQIDREADQLEIIVEEYNKVNEELAVTKRAIAAHTARLPALVQQLATAQSDVSEIATTAYKSGRLSSADALLNPAPGGLLLERLATLDHLAQGRQARIAGLATARRSYDVEKRRLDDALARQTIQSRDLAVRKTKIENDMRRLREKKRQAYGREAQPVARYTGKVPAVSGKAGIAVRFAYNAIGTPYVWGGESSKGYDCSGLTKAAWAAAGESLPHNAAMQWRVVAHISRSRLVPGDLVFYNNLGHVAIYVGGGDVIHSPHAGENVQKRGMDIMTPYGYGRVRS